MGRSAIWRRAISLAAGVLALAVPVRAAQPGLVRTRAVILDPASAPAATDGSVRLRLFAAGADVVAAAVAGTLRVRVRDAAGLDMQITVAGCRLGSRGASCRAGGLRARVLPRVLFGRSGTELQLRLKALPAAAVGTRLPATPIRISLDGLWRDAPLNLIRTCKAAGTTLRCGASRAPNVIVVLTDDQRWDSLEVMPQVQSGLVAQGVTFTNAFVTTPVCCPSRASILSGLYAHNHGTLTLTPPNGGAPGFVGPDASTMATWLQSVGYRTGLFGKYMNSYAALGPPARPTWYVPPGWTRWRALATPAYYDYDLVTEIGLVAHHGRAPADYSTDVTAADALAFVDAALAERVPFFVFYAPFAPHVDDTRLAPAAAPRHAGMFDDVPPFRPPAYNEDDVSDKPAWIRARAKITGLDEAFLDAGRRIGFAALQAVDEAVDALLDRVEAAGASDDTLVIFSSDNGYAQGEHRLHGKLCPYEECIRVPFVLRAPGVATAGIADARLVENVDVAATVTAMAGLAPPGPIDGRSLLPLVMGDAPPWRREVLIEQWRVFDSPEYFAVRNDAWKYVENRNTAEVELYDVLADPYELENRAGDPLLAERQAALRTLALARSTAPPGATP